MLTSKERAELRSQATTLDTTLMVGKSGITDALIAETENQLNTHELVKGKVLEGAMMTPREVLDELCEATGAEGVAVIGTKFVIYRFSQKLQDERNQVGRAKRKATPVSKSNPVRKGAKARRLTAKAERERRNEYFRQQAIDRAIERNRENQRHGEEYFESVGATPGRPDDNKGGEPWRGSESTAEPTTRPTSATCGRRSMPSTR